MIKSFLRVKIALLIGTAILITNLCHAQPANDECSGAIAVIPNATDICSNPVSSATAGATLSATAPPCGSIPASDVWFSFVAANTGYKFALNNVTPTNPNVASYHSFGIAIYSGNCGSLTELDCNFGSNSTVFGDDAVVTTVSGLTAGDTYYVQVWSDEAFDTAFNWQSNDINFDLCITLPPPPPANDACVNATILADGVALNGDNSSATDDIITGSAICGSEFNGFYKGVWYTATPTASGNLTIASCGSSFDTYLKIFSGGNCSNFLTCDSFDDDGCGVQSTVSFAAVAGTTYYILLGGFGETSFGAFTISATGVALPVGMTALSGTIVAGNEARLRWSTVSEQNNKGFEIQRSADGKTFRPAGFVASKGMNGNSQEKTDYTFTDPEAITGTVFYRLQQTDMDGKKTCSNTIRLGNGSTLPGISIIATPNPVTDRLLVTIEGRPGNGACLLLTDMSGKLLQRIPVTAATTDLNMHTLVPGIYLLRYTDAGNTQVQKIIRQ